jgi:hypothetical protein
VEHVNAFIGKTAQPQLSEILAVLGPSAPAWTEFILWMAERGVTTQLWKPIDPQRYGWSLRLLQKKRTIVYLGPCDGCFQASFVPGKKAVDAAHHATPSRKVIRAIDTARQYAEGRGVRILVQGPGDLPAIEGLAALKLAN